jgi:flagellar biosynthesis protein FlhA
VSTQAVTMPAPRGAHWLAHLREYMLPLAAISVVFVMLVPLPAAGLDFLLAISMAASIIVFLSAMQIRRAVELSVFPTLLLLLTLFRLSLNIASSRRILLHGSEGTAAAGEVIQAFGQFVVGGNYVVGFVLFLALIAIQFLVVSHGAVRTAEVTARFTLDALPGKQMAIDADMNAGLIDEVEARRRRQAIAREAEFYGAMDGAARFNQRDSMATILITSINIIAGLLIGTLQQGVALSEAVHTYTVLTVGDGLVTMIPSLLVSVAGGITLTRANSAGQLGGEIRSQLLARPATLYLSSLVSACMCLIPGLPKFTFLLVAAVLFYSARRVAAAPASTAVLEPVVPEREKKKTQAPELAALTRLEDLTLEIGFQLIPLVDEKQGGQLLNRVRALRRHLSSEMGFLIPPVHISDNLRLRPREYLISLRGMEIGRWQTEGAHLLAVSGDPQRRPLSGRETREPAFGVPAVWIAPQLEEQAIAAGYSVVDATTVITTHLGELIRTHGWQLVGRAEIKRLMDGLNESHPRLIEELVPKLLTLGEVGRVLEQLVRERVTIRDIGMILEALIETAAVNKSTVALVEAARQAIGRRIVQPLLDPDGQLPVLLLGPAFEEQILAALAPESGQRLLPSAAPPPAAPLLRRLAEHVKQLIGSTASPVTPVLLCPSPARYHVKRWLEPVLPRLAVLSAGEIPPEVRLRPLGTVHASS